MSEEEIPPNPELAAKLERAKEAATIVNELWATSRSQLAIAESSGSLAILQRLQKEEAIAAFNARKANLLVAELHRDIAIDIHRRSVNRDAQLKRIADQADLEHEEAKRNHSLAEAENLRAMAKRSIDGPAPDYDH